MVDCNARTEAAVSGIAPLTRCFAQPRSGPGQASTAAAVLDRHQRAYQAPAPAGGEDARFRTALGESHVRSPPNHPLVRGLPDRQRVASYEDQLRGMSFLRKADASSMSRGSAEVNGVQAKLECDLVAEGTEQRISQLAPALAAGPIHGVGVQQHAEPARPDLACRGSSTVNGADG